MKYRFSILFVFLFYFSNAQSVFAPVGSSFNYDLIDEPPAYNGTKSLNYTGDTTIAQIAVKKIVEAWYYTPNGPYQPISGANTEYIYERNDSIFQFFPYDTTFQLLYSFNQPVGDSISLSTNLTMVLDSVNTVLVCGQNRRVLFYDKIYYGSSSPQYCTDTIRIIEGIAPVNDYLFIHTQAKCIVGQYFNFTCANINGCIYPSSANNCSSILGITSHTKNQSGFVVYPNPANKILNIEVGSSSEANRELKISNALGEVLKEDYFKLSNENVQMDVSSLKNGIYFIRIGNSIQKFVKE